MPDKISIIIVNWNGEQFLERCLAALMAQTFKPHEIIVVDNASSDNSIEIVQRFSSVRLLTQHENLGFARGNNIAIEAANTESEWIALLNPDAYVEPSWLESLYSAVHDYPTFDVFGSKLVNADNPMIIDGTGDAYHLSGLVWRISHGTLASNLSDQVREIFSPCAAAALYRRSALITVGGFDEDFFCYVEDVDLGFRLRLAGYRCLYVPSSIALHVGSGTTGGKNSDFSVYHGHRNLVWAYTKNMPASLFWLLLPLHLLLNIVTIFYFTSRGQGKIILHAKLDAARGIPKMWSKRRAIQAKRVPGINEILRILDKRFFICRK